MQRYVVRRVGRGRVMPATQRQSKRVPKNLFSIFSPFQIIASAQSGLSNNVNWFRLGRGHMFARKDAIHHRCWNRPTPSGRSDGCLPESVRYIPR